MTIDQPIRWAQGGFGKHAWDHMVAAMLASGEAELVKVVDVDVDAARSRLQRFPTEGVEQALAWGYPVPMDAAQRLSGVPVVESIDEVLADPEIDAVVITTHADTHADYAIRALQAGKHVHVAKPLATSLEDLDRVLAVDAATPGMLQLGCQWTEAAEWVRKLISEGTYGRLRHVVVRLCREDGIPPNPAFHNPATGGVIRDCAGHAFSPVTVATDSEPIEVWAEAFHNHGLPVEDRAAGVVLDSDGVQYEFVVDWKTKVPPMQEFKADYYFDRGKVEWSSPGWDRQREPYQSFIRPWDGAAKPGPQAMLETEANLAQVTNWLRALQGKEPQRFPAKKGGRTERIVHGIGLAVASGGRVTIAG